MRSEKSDQSATAAYPLVVLVRLDPRTGEPPSLGGADAGGGGGRESVIFRPMFPLESLFAALNEGGGRYVLVGGLAVVLHGHLRATGDVDLVVDLAPEQVNRTLAALEQAGFRPYVPVAASEFADPARRAEWIRDKAMLVFSLRPREGVPLVDLFLEPPLAFDQLWEGSVVITMRGVPVRVVALNDLIELKRLAGRPEDLADAAALEELKRLREEHP